MDIEPSRAEHAARPLARPAPPAAARDLMTRVLARVHPTDSLARAARVMLDRRCGSAIVVDPDGAPVAMLTDRDVCLAALRFGRGLADMTVQDAMSRALHTCGPGDSLVRVAELMAQHQVRRLPVVEAGRRLVGIVSLDDLAAAARAQEHLQEPSLRPADVGRTLGAVCCKRDDARDARPGG